MEAVYYPFKEISMFSETMIEAFVGAFFGFIFSLGLFLWQLRIEFKRDRQKRKKDSIEYLRFFLTLSKESFNKVSNYLEQLESTISRGKNDYYENVDIPGVPGGAMNIDLLISFIDKELFDSFKYSRVLLKTNVDPFLVVSNMKSIENVLIEIKNLIPLYYTESQKENIAFMDKIQVIMNRFLAMISELASLPEAMKDDEVIERHSHYHDYMRLYLKLREDDANIKEYLDFLKTTQDHLLENWFYEENTLAIANDIQECKNHAYKKSTFSKNCIESLTSFADSIGESVNYLTEALEFSDK